MNPIQWHVIVPIILIGAVVLLFGLPIGAVWVVNSSGCCLANGTESLVTFWASLSAGFLALFGMVVTGVFIVTAFRVNAEARAEARTSAQKEAEKVARTYVKRHKRKLFKKMEQAKNEVEKRADETKGKIDAVGNDAKRDIETAASGAKKELLNTLTKEANEATDQITTTRDEIIAAMDKVRGDVERKGDEATQAIAVAQQEAQRQIDQTVGGSREGESEGKPE